MDTVAITQEEFAAHAAWTWGNGGTRLVKVGAILHGADMRRANLYSANLSGAILYRAILRGANLSEANLSEANLSEAILRGANLSEANLSEANLRGADMHGADMHGANLYSANLSSANLSGANLYRANLSGANLYRANINWGSHDLIAEILHQAAGNRRQRRALAGLILISRDLCWSDFLALRVPRTVREWALDTLRPFTLVAGAEPPAAMLIALEELDAARA